MRPFGREVRLLRRPRGWIDRKVRARPPVRRPATVAAATLVAALGVASAACAAFPVQDDPWREAQIDSLVRAVVVRVYEGRLDLAQEAIEAAAAIDPGDPRIGLYRFRVARENYPDEMTEVDRARRREPALLAMLEQTIAAGDSLLEHHPQKSAAGYLYRGWGKMMKAQVHAIARHFKDAAFTGKSARKDFDRFYELVPKGDPDADTVLGAFLYFTDIIPGFVKFLNWIIRIPNGDRERGLELIARGASGNGYTWIDAKVLQTFIFYMFEGRTDESRAALAEYIRDYPLQPRIVELYANAGYLFPDGTTEPLDAVDWAIENFGREIRGWDKLYQHRLRIARARLYEVHGRYEDAIEEYGIVIEHGSREPKWLVPVAKRARISIRLALGDPAAAVECDRFLANEYYDDFHNSVEALCEYPRSPRSSALHVAVAPVRGALYGGRLDHAADLLEGLEEFEGEAELEHLRGELFRLTGEPGRAAPHFARALDLLGDERPPGPRIRAAMRLGDSHFGAGQLREARDAYETTTDWVAKRTTLGTLLRGRVDFFERAAQ